MFSFGKHIGKPIDQVLKEDPDYIMMWMNFKKGNDWVGEQREKIVDVLREHLQDE